MDFNFNGITNLANDSLAGKAMSLISGGLEAIIPADLPKLAKVEQKQDGGNAKEVVKVNEEVALNEIVKDSTASSIIVKAFNIWFKDRNYYLAMCKLDNDVKINDYLLTPKDFKSVVMDLQKYYKIYNHGVNVFIDGNIVYVVNSITPSTMDFMNDFTYKFITVSETYNNLRGNYPIIIDPKEKVMSTTILDTHVEFLGHNVDTSKNDPIVISAGSGKAVTLGSSAVDKQIIVDPSGSDIKLPDATKKEKYEIATIRVMQSIHMFTPASKIEIYKFEDPTYKWSGTVKRWASEQTYGMRYMYFVAIGKIEENKSILGNLDIKAAIVGDAADNILGGITEAIDTFRGVTEKIKQTKDQIRDVIKDAPKMIGKLGTSFMYDVTKFGLDKVLDKVDKKALNDFINTATSVASSPHLKALLESYGTPAADLLGLKIDKLMEIINSGGGLEYMDKNYGYDIFTAIPNTINGVVDTLSKIYHWADTYDVHATEPMFNDVFKTPINKESIFYKEFIKVFKDESQIDVFKAVLISNGVNGTNVDSLKHVLDGLHTFIINTRKLYKDDVLSKNTLPDNKDGLFEYDNVDDKLEVLDVHNSNFPAEPYARSVEAIRLNILAEGYYDPNKKSLISNKEEVIMI